MTAVTRQETINDHIRNNPFARYLGATIVIIAPGHSRVSVTVAHDMVNFHGITHGGLIFALSDIAFEAASNSHGQTAVALNVNMHFLKASKPGDRLLAEAWEIFAGGRTALYEINVTNETTGDVIATSQDLVYRTRNWFVPPDEDKNENDDSGKRIAVV